VAETLEKPLPWRCEYSIEVDVSPAFAWSYWTNVDNWSDPPARFALDGPFVTGSRGITSMPGQEPQPWTLREVEAEKFATIQAHLDRALMSFEWRFEQISDCQTRITQRIELTGENAEAYAEARSAFSANLPGGMKKIAAAITRAYEIATSVT